MPFPSEHYYLAEIGGGAIAVICFVSGRALNVVVIHSNRRPPEEIAYIAFPLE